MKVRRVFHCNYKSEPELPSPGMIYESVRFQVQNQEHGFCLTLLDPKTGDKQEQYFPTDDLKLFAVHGLKALVHNVGKTVKHSERGDNFQLKIVFTDGAYIIF